MSHAPDRAGRGDDPTEREGEGASPSIAEQLAIEQRGEWRRGFDAGRRGAIATLLFDSKRPSQLRKALVSISLELTLARTTIDTLAAQLEWHREKLRDAYAVILRPRR